VLVTFDSDFGDLVFHQGATPPPGILPEAVLNLTLMALEQPGDGSLVVVTPDSLRRRRFPHITVDGTG
jgi:hypothetical protein